MGRIGDISLESRNEVHGSPEKEGPVEAYMVAEALLERPRDPASPLQLHLGSLSSGLNQELLESRGFPWYWGRTVELTIGVSQPYYLCFFCSVRNCRLALCSSSVAPQLCIDFSDLDPFLKGPPSELWMLLPGTHHPVMRSLPHQGTAWVLSVSTSPVAVPSLHRRVYMSGQTSYTD